MRILVVGDQHFRFELPYASAFPDGRRGEWKEVIAKIHEQAKRCDVVVLLGDNLNTRHNHSSVIKEFIEFLKGFGTMPVHILVGNHERYGEHTALDFLQKLNMPTWHVYSSITNDVELKPGVTASFVPYLTPAMVGAQDKQEGVVKALQQMKPADVAFLHQGIAEGASHGTMVDTFNEIVFARSDLESRYGKIFAGHIHQPMEISEKTIQTGSIFPQEVGDTEKNIYIYDFSRRPEIPSTVEVIPLPIRGIYKVGVGDQDDTFAHVPDHSIVKCVVVDKQVDLEVVRQNLKRFDAAILIEAYPNEREKVHFEEGGLDISVDGLLKLYAKTKGLPHSDLQEGFELIK